MTLHRVPGLRIDRRIPCPGHDGEPCSHEFKYEQLVRRLEMTPLRFQVECPEASKDLDVRTLLFGLAASTMDDVLREVQALRAVEAERHEELVALLRREFAKSFEREQAKIDSHCPNVFALYPAGSSGLRQAVVGERTELHLYCQYPRRWHPTALGGKYKITI